MSLHTRYTVNISRRETPSRPFGWEICQQDGVDVERSTNTFSTRGEALADSGSAAALLILKPHATVVDTPPEVPHARTLLARFMGVVAKMQGRSKGARPAT